MSAPSIRFFGNAFVEIRLSDGRRIACDPWILEGAYYGSWWHFPPFRVPPGFYEGVDYLFVSHLHPDHLHAPSLAAFDPSTPVIVSERSTPVVERMLKGLGFRQVLVLPAGEEHDLGGVRVRVWNDFGGEDVGRGDQVDFDLDSSIAVVDGEHVVLNVNDNVIEPEAAEAVAQLYPRLRCALVPYAGAGPYPQLFDNLTHEEKLAGRQRVQARFLRNFVDVSRALGADLTVPVAGEYVLAGRVSELTQYLHTPEPREVAEAWRAAGLTGELVQLGAGDVLDLGTGEVQRACGDGPPSHTHADRVAYAHDHASTPLEIDGFAVPAALRLPPSKLVPLLTRARQHLLRRQEADGLFPATTLVLDVPGTGRFATPLSTEAPWVVEPAEVPEPSLRVTIDYAVLVALLTTHVSWNNLELGCHLRFDRRPEVYDPDVHTLLSFLHL